MKLLNAIQARFPSGLAYQEAVQLCLWLHAGTNTFPSDRGAFSGEKSELAETFAALARGGHIRNQDDSNTQSPSATEINHWVQVIESIYKGNAVLDFDFPRKLEDVFVRSDAPAAGGR